MAYIFFHTAPEAEKILQYMFLKYCKTRIFFKKNYYYFIYFYLLLEGLIYNPF